MESKRILLICPAMGVLGAFVYHLPLNLLYASIESIKSGFEVDIVDVRLCPDKWREEISSRICSETVLVGVSVMSGTPIGSALAITRWLKNRYPHIHTVWGGPHATFDGHGIMVENGVDFVICGNGSLALARLARWLRNDSDALQLNAIPGLIFRSNDDIHSVSPENCFEQFDYRDIPYYLIEKDLDKYGQLDTGDRIFSMYSAMGCPYKCAFCSSPAQYGSMDKKYEMLLPSVVVDHIDYVHSRFDATYIYIIDDDSFVSLGHVEAIIDEINRRGIKVGLGFRGARIDEILRMDDAYLKKLAAAGTTILHIGAESGSQRMLDLMKKDCTVQDIIDVNRKLANHPEITAAYNWLIGLPGETLEDLRQTRELIMQLISENRTSIMFIPNKYRPLPGTELFSFAVSHGYKRPETLEEWVDVEVEGDFRCAWYDDKFAKMVNMMCVTSYFIDNKLFKVKTGSSLKYFFARFAAILYAPVAKLRYRFGVAGFLFEYAVFSSIVRKFRN